MAKNPEIERQYRQRIRVLNQARDLARSGVHADHRSIIPHLECLEGFAIARERLQDRTFRTQLDRLCTMARDPNRTQVDLVALRASR